jgi:hypothetical protein
MFYIYISPIYIAASMPITQVPTPITQVSPKRREGDNLDDLLGLLKVQLMQSMAQNMRRPPSQGGGGGGGSHEDGYKDGYKDYYKGGH